MIITDSGSTIEQEEYKDEDELQDLIFKHPELISEENSELTSIMREVGTRAGRIDVLDIAENGIITIVEVKLARNPQSRREVLAQIFDYISELSNYSYYEFRNKCYEECPTGLTRPLNDPSLICVPKYIYSFNYSNYGCFFTLLIWLYDWR